ncbi:MAG: tetratricopeptide repeat protein [Phycisphaerales bacterium]|jgi:tetratricopeptide (TPR) repeat protein|nr:tetratricopeptide repeat protein [Phycisphaerales bacterium]
MICRKNFLLVLVVIALMLLQTGSIATAADTADKELLYPGEDFAKLDTFESVAVEDADKLFIKRDYRGAYAAYKAYTFEFAKGKALPYVLLRMGRCLHLLGKRNTAVKAYQDVVAYFPDDVRYAAAALYYIGECHAQNGNEAKSLAAWARLVKDKDYVSQPRSGSALASLATAMEKRGKFEEATSYRWRTAVAFRKSNQRASEAARNSVVYHYVARAPNQKKLLQFCNEVGGFGWRHVIAKPEDSPTYWSHVLGVVLQARLESEKKTEIARYWSEQLGARFTDNDPLRVAWFNVLLIHEKDSVKWAERMEKQFKLQPVTIKRVQAWLGYYSRAAKARSAFFAKYGQPLVAGLKNAEKMALMNLLRHPHRMDTEAVAVLRTVRTDGMDDGAVRELAMFAAMYETEETVLRYIGKIKDRTFAARVRFDYYYARSHRNGPFQEKALAEIPVLRKSPKHAQDIVWSHATLMQWQGKLPEAIKLYQAANRQPQSTWAVIDCLVTLKQYDKAIKLTRELESLGAAVASAACLKAADIYRSSGNKGKEVQQLQLVLRRYPKSSESSKAHGRLETYGVKLIGGESEAEE